MNLNLVTEVVCKSGEEVFSLVKSSPKSYTWNNIELQLIASDSYDCNISTFGARNCYGTGNIYKNKILEKMFRVIQFVSNGQRSSIWDFNLEEQIKIEKEKIDKFIKFMEEKFSDSEVNKEQVNDDKIS
eukprot:gene1343-11425_t